MSIAKSPVRFLTTASLATVALASAVQAQRAADDAIVVIGITKQAADIQDTPIAITAFSGETLVEQGITKVDEIATFTPGFNMRGAGNNPTSLTLSMRGQIQVDTLATLEPSVGTYLDGMYVARSYGLNFELVDVENVQVMKGPQGTLFGRNTSAGAVLLQTADPRYDEISGRAKFTYGRFNERTAEGVINLGLSDRAALRGAIYYQKRDGYKTDINTGQKYEGRETISGRVKLAARPTDTLEVILSGEWYDTDIDGPVRHNLFFNAPAAFGPAKPIVDGMVAQERETIAGKKGRLVALSPGSAVQGADPRGAFTTAQTQTYMARINLDAEIGQLSWINGYRQVKTSTLVDLDGASFVGHLTQMTANLKQYSSELQWTGSAFDDRLDYAAGATYFRETGFEQSHTNLFGATYAAGPGIPPEAVGHSTWSRFYGEIDNHSFGVYSQLHYRVTDQLGITGGIRYSVDDKGLTSANGSIVDNSPVYVVCDPVTLAAPCRRSKEQANFNNFSYTAGIDYQVTPDILFYAKYSKGYRSGAMQLRTLTLADALPAKPEIVREQEVGLKTTFWDGRATFNIAGFHNKVKGAQRSPVLAPDGKSQTVLENADTETWGIEADASIQVAKGFTLFANGALIDPKYTNYEGKGVAGPAGGQVIVDIDKTDYRFNGIVKKQFAVGAALKQDLAPNVGLDANIVYAWEGRMSHIEIPYHLYTSTGIGGLGLTQAQADALQSVSERQPLGILNARVALNFGAQRNFEVALWGRNLTNAQEQQYTLLLSNIYVGTSYNEPRTYGLSVSAKF